jgi:thiazole synthase
MLTSDTLVLANRQFSSRLFIGTGKFSSVQLMTAAIAESETELVTVALRRMDLNDPSDQFLESIDSQKILLVPNTSGARNAREAVKLSQLARVAGCESWIKLELTPEPRHLLPDPIETLLAAEQLVKNGFTVLPYINADPILAKKLEDVGVAAVMPLGSPIGSNRGIETKEMIRIIIENASVPVIVDAGIGFPSHAALAMELGADAVLVNTAIATAKDPVAVARAFCLATIAGRIAYLNSCVSASQYARPSSPAEDFIRELAS